ncbi:polysaccharide deacetylase, partial [Ostertagia ostertagi]
LSLRKLKYGQLCHNGKDTCTFGAVCIDSVCKCGPGYALSTNGWCEPFDFKPSAKNGNSYAQFTRPAISTMVSTRPPTPFTNGYAVQGSQYATTSPYGHVDRPALLTSPPTQQPQFSTSPAPKVVRHRFLGTKCRENDVCINGGECLGGICQCPENLFERGGRCLRASQIPHAAPSEPCENGEMCTGGSICDNDSKTCICAANHVIVGGVCRSEDASPFSLPGESCTGGEECSGNSACVSGTCQCAADHYVEDGYCRHIASQSSPVKFVAGSGLRFSSKSSTPRAPAAPCDETICRLPDCFCSTSAPNSVPQFVVLTFDDAVNGRTFPDYLELFETVKYRNPNGCPVKGTFFVSHEWTNYDAVQWLFQQGMELASNSISHVSLEGTDANRWLNEMDGQRRIMAKFANANEEEIVGMRAPQLVLGGDEQFDMMARAGFVYDNSMSVNPGVNGEPYWPQTLDHTVPWACYDAQCPTSSFPGLWVIPLNQFYGSYIPQIDSFRRSSMIRAAVDLNTTVDQLTNMLFSNFDRSYLGNRAPYVLSLNADLLQLNGRNTGMQALQRFSEAVKCAQSFNQYPAIARKSCSKPNKCMYRTPGLGSQEHQFLTCSPCPDQYPWLDNPIGNASF